MGTEIAGVLHLELLAEFYVIKPKDQEVKI